MSFNSRWPIVPIGKVVANKDSKRIPLKQADRAARQGEYPYYGASGIIDYVDEYLFEGPHLLIGEDGANLLARSTPIAFMATGKFWVNNHAHVLGATDKIDLKYLEYFFATLDLEPYVTGSAQPKLNRKNLDRIPIPLPPLAEQRRIAAILDKADAIRRKRQQAIQYTEELLRAAFLDMFGDPVTNPKGWETEVLSEVVDPDTIVTYGIVQAGPEVENGVPYIRTGDIKDGRIIEENLLKTSPEIAQKYKRSEVHTGDLVMSIRATVGTVAEVPASLDGANLTQGTAKISPGPKVIGSYLFEFIRSNGCQDWLQRQVKGATFREITLKRLREMPVMVPPLRLQSEFDQVVQRIRDGNDKYIKADSESNGLFNSLLQRAFRGEL